MAELKLHMKSEASMKLKQEPGMPIAEFKKEFQEQVEVLVCLQTPKSKETIKFLLKLDRARHGAMLVELKNQAARGIPYFPTVEDAYNFASTWRSYAKTGRDVVAGDEAVVFMLSDEVHPPAGGKNKGPPKSHKPSEKDAQAEQRRESVYGVRANDVTYEVMFFTPTEVLLDKAVGQCALISYTPQ